MQVVTVLAHLDLYTSNSIVLAILYKFYVALQHSGRLVKGR